jgi:zinc protease
MNLREDKHWSYGAGSLVFDARGQRPLMVYAPVQTDKTKESIEEVVKELRTIVGDKPLTADELTKVQQQLTRSLPGRWETIGSVQASIAEIVQFDLPLDYYDKYAGAVRGLQLAQVNTVAKDLIHPQAFVWVIVGDRSKIEEGVRSLNLGPLQLLDADGKLVGQAPTPSAAR